MAEIRIEKKSYAWIWWLIGLIVLALVIWLIVGSGDDEAETAATTITEQEAASTANAEANKAGRSNNPYVTYSMWVNNEANMGRHHEFTQEGLRNLAQAISYTAEYNNLSNDIEVNAEVEKIRSMANDITNDWQSTDHGNKINKAFTQAANVIDKIQDKKFQNLNSDVDELKNLANEVDPKTLTLNQKEGVKNFFEKADNVLSEMNK